MFEERLAQEIKKRKCLYEKTNGDYNNYKLKENAWDEVSAVLGTPLNKCKARWKSLRERYVREVKRNRRLRISDDVSNWPLFPQMTFLKDFICPRTRYPDHHPYRIITTNANRANAAPGRTVQRTPEGGQNAQYLNDLMEIMSDSSGDEVPAQLSPFQTPRITAAFSKPREPEEDPIMTNGVDFSTQAHNSQNQDVGEPHEISIQPPTISPTNAGFFLMLDKMLKRLPADDVFDFQMDVLNFVHQKVTEKRPKEEIFYASDE